MTTAPTTPLLVPPYRASVTLGCDPEFFFKQGRQVIGSENIIPKKGLKDNNPSPHSTQGKVVIDGVQAELNPTPSTCRDSLAIYIRYCFQSLKKEMDAQKTKTDLSLARSVTISKGELAKLDKDNQKLGCAPSLNTYDAASNSAKLSAVDPLVNRQRSAGGHLHFSGDQSIIDKINANPTDIIMLMDIIVGNTCVLIDRDKGNAKRRELYGYAGEYRLPKHGIEYRTLSNFWLQSKPLMSLVTGLGRLAIRLAACPRNGAKYIEAFTSAVDIKEVQKAINTNNFELAYKNFKAIEPLLMQVCADEYGETALAKSTFKEFHYFIKRVGEKGLNYWFPTDVLTHWVDAGNDKLWLGFNEFLIGPVRKEMNSPMAKAARVVKKAIVTKKSVTKNGTITKAPARKSA